MEDLRQTRTRDALYAALEALLGERRYSEITISDLTARARVGRPTFYRHFRDIDEMLFQQLRTDLAAQLEMARGAFGDDENVQSLREIAAFAFERVGERPDLYRLILSGEAGSQALALFREQVGNLLALEPGLSGTMNAEEILSNYTHSFYAGSISAVLLCWIEAGREPDAEAMGALYVKLLTSGGALPIPSDNALDSDT